MKILITGVSSFLGKGLASTLSKQGHYIVGTSIQAQSISGVEKVFKYSLNDNIDNSIFEGVDLIIHMAWDLKQEAMANNINGTIKLAKAGIQRNINKQIFISSLSAHSNAKSAYGKGKRECEIFFKQNNFQIVRPGLVIGDGGGYKNIYDTVKKSFILPLIDSGRNPIQFISQSDFNTAMTMLVALPFSKEINLCDENTTSLKELTKKIANELNKKLILIPIPSWLLLLAISVLNILHLPTPISKEQILGYISNDKVYFHKTDLSSKRSREILR